jgi:L-alanine-DL-glutamate epimerase-like enolase superfamily enzyme
VREAQRGGGLIAVPTEPGLGVVVNEDLVRQYGETAAL